MSCREIDYKKRQDRERHKDVLPNMTNLANLRGVKRISYGVDPEEGFPVYYFHTERFDPELSNQMTELEIKISKSIRQIFLSQCPLRENSDIEDFRGRTIWER